MAAAKRIMTFPCKPSEDGVLSKKSQQTTKQRRRKGGRPKYNETVTAGDIYMHNESGKETNNNKMCPEVWLQEFTI